MGGSLQRIGLVFLLVGAVLIVAGLLAPAGSRWFGWLGRLPGDIRIDGPTYAIRIPLATSVLISLAITLVMNMLRRR
jgi:preprotein translocase subunit Sec61beta